MNVYRTSAVVLSAIMLVSVGCRGGGSAGGGGPRSPKHSPIHMAAMHNDAATVRALLGEGIPADSTLANGRTPLHYAVAEGMVQSAQALLDAGASPSAQDARGDTPLMMAANRRLSHFVQMMLAKRPSLNEQNRRGYSALHFAADQQAPEIVRMLVAAGADTKLVDTKGRTPADVAKGNPMILAALRGETAGTAGRTAAGATGTGATGTGATGTGGGVGASPPLGTTGTPAATSPSR